MFIEGIFQLTRTEKVALGALLNTLTGWSLLGDAAKGGMQKAKDAALSWFSGLAASHHQAQLDKLEAKLNWDPDRLQQKLEAEMEALGALEPVQLEVNLRESLQRLAQVEGDDPAVWAHALTHRAAESLKLDVRQHLTAEALEEAVFQGILTEFLLALQKELTPKEAGAKRRLEEILQGELCKLKAGELEQVAQALPTEDATSPGILAWLGAIEDGQAFAQNFGSGSLLLLAVLLRATSLYTGVGFPLELKEREPALAFLLSGPFLYLTLTSSGSLLKGAGGNAGEQLAKLLLIIGKGKRAQ